MKQKLLIAIMVVILTLLTIISIQHFADRIYHDGYEMGVHQTAVYHHATGVYPCKVWRTEYMNNGSIQTKEDIIKTDICGGIK